MSTTKNAKRASRSAAPRCSPRCEGFRRYGGAFSLGPVTWEQCRETATVMLTVKQDGETQTLPACPTCWEESRNTKGITVTDAKPIAANNAVRGGGTPYPERAGSQENRP